VDGVQDWEGGHEEHRGPRGDTNESIKNCKRGRAGKRGTDYRSEGEDIIGGNGARITKRMRGHLDGKTWLVRRRRLKSGRLKKPRVPFLL